MKILIISAAGIFSTSDIRLKKNIKPIEGALENIDDLNGVMFNYKGNSNHLHSGVIAQELEKVLPHLVKTDTRGYKTVNYTELIPFLIEAIKEQQEIIDSLMASVEDGKVQMEDLKKVLQDQKQLNELQSTLMGQIVEDSKSIKSDLDDIKTMLGIDAKASIK